jgi:peroxiredoxin
MLEAGNRVPDVSVAVTQNETTTIAELARKRPILVLFYLFDWSST